MNAKFASFQDQKAAIDAAVQHFEEVSRKFASFGAYDTEPRCQFQEIVDCASNDCPPPHPFETMVADEWWQLYTCSMKCGTAARSLTAAAKKVDALIRATSKQEDGFRKLNQRR